MCVSGCTGSGKTKWVLRMLANLDTLVAPAHISGVLYCYGEEAVKRAAKACGGRLLLVLDDLMVGMRVPHLFTRELRIARNNAHYLVLLRNPAGALQVRSLGIQLFPGPGALHHFLEAYDDATADPFGYLLIDMHPTTRPLMRLKTHIYPGQLTVVYAPRASAATQQQQKKSITKQPQQQQQQPPQKHRGPRPSKYISRNLAFFKLLSKCRSARGRAYRKLVRSATGEQLLCLVESALNILRSRVPLRGKHLDGLRAQAQHDACARPTRSGHGARRVLLRQQTGRGVPSVGRPPGQRRSAPSG
ncbi:hypothetical protein niasHS_004134 [Heterodera schachtii]|uniref:Uncharacterized protein n=1 Tax=Heterodera schachtii TaxID=97005 RepID=A0ABD2K0M0_HETSC